jgi:hypothetical protein
MNKSESITNLALALAKAQGELSNPKKTSANPFFKSRYADLSEVINVSKSVLSEHGLSVVQLASYSDSMAHVETIILHATGEFISETLSLPVVKHDAQSIGSVITYARRYSWAAICGLAQEDDDGNAAIGRTNMPTPVNYKASIESASTLEQLTKIWKSIPHSEQEKLTQIATAQKLKLTPDQEAA